MSLSTWLVFNTHAHTHTQGVFKVSKERDLQLVEIGEEVSLEDVRAATGASFQVYTIL